MDQPESITVRSVNQDEWIDFSEIGVPIMITGPNVKVVDHEDGESTVCLMPNDIVVAIEMFALVRILIADVPITPHGLHFVRTTLGISSRDAAKMLGISRHELKRIEYISEDHLDPVLQGRLRSELKPLVEETMLKNISDSDRFRKAAINNSVLLLSDGTMVKLEF